MPSSATRYDLHHVLSFSDIPPCLITSSSSSSPSASIVAYQPLKPKDDPSGLKPPPLKCENRVYVHSNFASSTAYLLGVLLAQHEPKTEFCLVKDDTVSLRDGYEDEVREEKRDQVFNEERN